MEEYQTRKILELIYNCDNLDDFRKDVLQKLESQRHIWQEKINQLIERSGVSKEGFARLCGVSRTTVAKWCNGSIPQSRDMFIRIGFACQMNYEEINFFLQRYGGYSCLYPKSLEDSICIFVLHSETLEHSYQNVERLLERIQALSYSYNEDNTSTDDSTVFILSHLLSSKDEIEIERFIERNKKVFFSAYGAFYSYVIAFLKMNNLDTVENREYSVHMLANSQNWSSSLRHVVSAIRQKKWIPVRRKVIALGLHLNMDVEQINEMLSLAKMECLCPKNAVECALIYAIEDASLNDMIVCDGCMDLCHHVSGILRQLNLSEAGLLLADLETIE